MSYESVVLEDTPKHFLRLGESSGTEAKDASGNVLPGTYKGSPALGVAGLLGGDANTAVSLGKGQFIERAHNALLNVGDVFTLEAWIKLNAVGGGVEHCICFKIGSGTTPKFVVSEEGKLLLRVPGFANLAVGKTTLAIGTVYHVVATKSGTTIKLYLNGVDDTGATENRTTTNNSGTLRWGSEEGEAAENFNGVLDECAYYSTALSEPRVKAHWVAGHRVVEGKAAGSGAGSGAAKGSRGRQGKGTGAGTGTGSAKGTRTRQGQGAGAGAGSGSSAGTRTRQAGAAGVGAGGASGSANRTRLAQAAGSGAGSGAASGGVAIPEGQSHGLAVTREFPPDDLAIRISDPTTGRTIARWAADEGDIENVIDSLSYSSEMQGGPKESSGTLARDPRIRWTDLYPYLDKTIYGAGMEERWWGRIDKPEGSEGNQTLVTPKGVGHLAALEDNEAVTFGGINSDQSAWTEPSIDRRKALIKAGTKLSPAVSVGWQGSEPEGTSPRLLMDFSNVETAVGTPLLGTAVFDSGAIGIGQVLYELAILAGPEGGTAWLEQIQTAADSAFTSGFKASSDLNATATQSAAEAGEGSKYAAVVSQYTDTSSGTKMSDLHGWLLKVVGPHGLALQGTWPNVGFTAKQMLEWVVPRFSYLEARSEDLEDDGFIIPHAWFAEMGTLATIVKELTKYGLLDWFVKDGKRLQMRFPGTYGRRWVAAPGPAELNEEGEDGTRLWRDIVVQWEDVDGSTKTVGPPGSGATFEVSGLEITDPDHPAVRADLTRRDLLVAKTVGDLPSSVKLGENWLSEANDLSRSGSCNLSGYVMDDKSILRPASCVQAGDEVFFPGSGDPSYRRITHVDYDHPERKAACSLDAPPEGLAALQERFQVRLAAAGVG